MRRRFLFVSAGCLAVAAILYSALWFVASNNLQSGVENWAADRRAAGWIVAWKDISIGGFPFVLRARVKEPRIAGPNSSWDWRGPELIATARPWDLSKPEFTFPGRHHLSMMKNGTTRVFILTAVEAFGRVEIQGNVPRDITAKLAQIEFRSTDGRLPSGHAAAGQNITADAMSFRLELPQLETPEPVISVALAGVLLPDGPAAVLGRNIRALDTKVKLLGLASFKPSSRLRLSAALGDWRDGGGTVEIKRLHLDWGKMKFDGDGTIALDADLQPVGAMRARIQGYRALVDSLVRARQIPTRDADMAKFVLNMVARATPGGKNTITVPVTVQDRRLFIGPASLMKLPRIDWEN
ncbi:MAG: DUF2125 domain-containing protein [Rhodospirillales bacterium]|nr:DUF2125 domain-containing protein [Rhodospirillales bacterium]